MVDSFELLKYHRIHMKNDQLEESSELENIGNALQSEPNRKRIGLSFYLKNEAY